MKKLLIASLLALAPVIAFAAVSGTQHDFTVQTGTTCGGCHRPHGAGNLIPLWNGDNTYTGTYQDYVSPNGTGSLQGAYLTPNTLSNGSTACMACHDGQSEAGTTVALAPAATLDLNTTFANHPVGISYLDSADIGGDADLKDSTTVANVKLFNDGTNDYIDCASCHDPHNDTNSPFLRAAKATICEECHTK